MTREQYWKYWYDIGYDNLRVKLGTSVEYAQRVSTWYANVLTATKYGND